MAQPLQGTLVEGPVGGDTVDSQQGWGTAGKGWWAPGPPHRGRLRFQGRHPHSRFPVETDPVPQCRPGRPSGAAVSHVQSGSSGSLRPRLRGQSWAEGNQGLEHLGPEWKFHFLRPTLVTLGKSLDFCDPQFSPLGNGVVPPSQGLGGIIKWENVCLKKEATLVTTPGRSGTAEL